MKRPLIMGVVNVTPDSFSDGGAFASPQQAIAHGLALVAAGADVLDIGGEATNPRAAAVSASEELARVMPVIEGLAAAVSVPLSIDTTKASVAAAALGAGCSWVNDISGGAFDSAMVELIADSDATYICGHVPANHLAGVFANEANAATAADVIEQLVERILALPATLRSRTYADPCLGFGKGAGVVNFELIDRCAELAKRSGCPVLIGASRKRFLRSLLPVSGEHRELELLLDAATVGASLRAAAHGASCLRVHNVSLLQAALTGYTS